MKIGVLGTGMVGRAISGKLEALGHDVCVGSRTAGDGTVEFADAAAHGEIVFNCTSGAASLDALGAAGAVNLAGKVLIDVANPLDFSGGGPALFTRHHGQPRRADPGRVPGRPRGQVAEHHQLQPDGRRGLRAGRPRRLRVRQRRRRQGAGRASC